MGYLLGLANVHPWRVGILAQIGVNGRSDLRERRHSDAEGWLMHGSAAGGPGERGIKTDRSCGADRLNHALRDFKVRFGEHLFRAVITDRFKFARGPTDAA